MDIFVKKAEKILVDVFVWEQDDDLKATHLEGEVPSGVDAEIVKFTFKKADYRDSLIIGQAVQLKPTDNAPTPEGNIVDFQDAILKTLLMSVDQSGTITDMRGKINELHPTVARSAVAGALQKITI